MAMLQMQRIYIYALKKDRKPLLELLQRRGVVEISDVLLTLETDDAAKVFGSPDYKKLKSSMTLFSLLSGADEVFQRVLDKFFKGNKDEKTLQLLNM